MQTEKECSGCHIVFNNCYLTSVVPKGELFCPDCVGDAEADYHEYMEHLADQD